VREIDDGKSCDCRRTDVSEIIGLEEHLQVLHVVDAVAVGQREHLTVVEHTVHGLEPHRVNWPIQYYPLVHLPVNLLQVPGDRVGIDECQLLALFALQVAKHAFSPMFAYI